MGDIWRVSGTQSLVQQMPDLWLDSWEKSLHLAYPVALVHAVSSGKYCTLAQGMKCQQKKTVTLVSLGFKQRTPTLFPRFWQAWSRERSRRGPTRMLEPTAARLGSERARRGAGSQKRPAEGAPGPLKAWRWAAAPPGAGHRLQSGADHSRGRARYPPGAR